MMVLWSLLDPTQYMKKRTCCPTTVWKVRGSATGAVHGTPRFELGESDWRPRGCGQPRGCGLPAGYAPWAHLQKVVVLCHFSVMFSLFFHLIRELCALQDISLELISVYVYLLVGLIWDSVLNVYPGMFTQMGPK